jgi:hypothetical protein
MMQQLLSLAKIMKPPELPGGFIYIFTCLVVIAKTTSRGHRFGYFLLHGFMHIFEVTMVNHFQVADTE